jgi:SAM-dependent methyltransferase
LAEGLDVEGLDSSADMLGRCRAKASELGLPVALHQQRMESFAIDRVFRTIYCVSSSFMLLGDDDAARRALATIHGHLEPGGRLLVALHLPDLSDSSGAEWRVAREAVRPLDGSIVRCWSKVLGVDDEARRYESLFRYELIAQGRVSHQEERTFLLHWYTRERFAEMLAAAGFIDVTLVRGNGKPSQPSDRVFIVSAFRSAAPTAE